MNKEKVKLDGMHLVGISIRTNNQNELNPETAKISKLLDKYWGEQIANGIKNRVNAPVTYAVYTEYDSDEHGDYTYFLGEAVSSLERQDSETLQSMFIPAGAYQKFTTKPGKFPDVIINAWQKIWQMKEEDFGGKRGYIADFEVYDQRARDPNHAIVDIYIGIKDASK